jgi:hypothetical protein
MTRGARHNKQHRGDLRQVSLGMLVSTDFHVPLFHQVYAGNLTDATAVQAVSEELARRYRQLAQGCEHIALIFDKGNNSTEAFETLDASPFHFVGSLVPSQHADLLAIAADQFHELPGQRLAGCTAFQGFGRERGGGRPAWGERRESAEGVRLKVSVSSRRFFAPKGLPRIPRRFNAG